MVSLFAYIQIQILQLNFDLAFGETLAHTPDVTTMDGLLDIVMVGNMLELAPALSFKHFGKHVPEEVLEEQNIAMWRYRLFQSWFIRRYILVIADQSVNPCYLFNKSLIQFCAGLCSYMKRWEKQVKLGVTPKQVTAIVVDHFRNEWQDLLGSFEKILHEDPSNSGWFTWNGPHFSIFPCDESQVWTEPQDWQQDPVYNEPSDDDEEEEENDMSIDEEDLPLAGSKRSHSAAEGASAKYNYKAILFILIKDIDQSQAKRRK